MIDSHVHFWKYEPLRDAWITDEMKLIQRDFLPEHIRPVLERNNVKGVVAVQADQSEDETKFLINLAKKNPLIVGIVGWIDLKNEKAEERLNYYSQSEIIKGFRHIVQAEPDGFLTDKKFLKGVALLQKFRFTYDILIYQNQLREAVDFTENFPGQKFIVDHCAKPSIKNKEIKEWKKLMKVIAQNENVYCKLSGLITEAEWNRWKEADIYPYLDVVFDAFGTKRLLFGSDWPVMLLSGNYEGWKLFLEKYLGKCFDEEKQDILGENAIRFYNISL